jgi:hypothetical protein
VAPDNTEGPLLFTILFIYVGIPVYSAVLGLLADL